MVAAGLLSSYWTCTPAAGGRSCPERVQELLGGVDLLELGVGDALAVLDARGEAGHGRLVPGRQVELLGEEPDLCLGQAGLLERRADAELAGGLHARTVVALVVEVE